MPKALVIIPTYNERGNIDRIIKAVLDQPHGFHILIVDDGSPDGTAEIVKSMQAEYDGRLHIVERSGKLGLGTAYIAGFRWSEKNGYDFVFEMDADFSHNPNDLIRLYEACQKPDIGMSVGSRYVKGGGVVDWPLMRIFLSYFASVYVRLITWLPVKDTTAGFVCYRQTVLNQIDFDKIRFVGYAFQIEMKFATWKLGNKIEEVPITFADRIVGESKMSMNIFKEAVWGVLKMKLRSFSYSYAR